MARVKGGMNARKRHNRVLKLAKGYRGARSKQYRIAAVRDEGFGKRLCRKKAEKKTVQTAVDRPHQRGCPHQRIVLQ